MSVHRAELRWSAEGDFAAGNYSRRHEWRFDGGAVVTASSSPDVVPVPFSDPAGVDPEEALVAAISSCHMLWFLDLARRAGLDIASYADSAEGEMGRIEPGRMAMTRVTLKPRITFAGDQPDPSQIAALHERAHRSCFIANSLRTEVVINSGDSAGA